MSTEKSQAGIVLGAVRVEVRGSLSLGPVPGTPEFEEYQRRKRELAEAPPPTLRSAGG